MNKKDFWLILIGLMLGVGVLMKENYGFTLSAGGEGVGWNITAILSYLWGAWAVYKMVRIYLTSRNKSALSVIEDKPKTEKKSKPTSFRMILGFLAIFTLLVFTLLGYAILVFKDTGSLPSSTPKNVGSEDASKLEVFDRDGIHFSYPKGLDVTYGNFTFQSNIDVIRKGLGLYSRECNRMFSDREIGPGDELWLIGSKQEDRLKTLKNEGLNGSNVDSLIEIDPIDCYTSRYSEISEHVYKIEPWSDGDTNGLIRYQYRGSDCCSIENFTAELTAVNKYNEIITIVFRYNFAGYNKSDYTPGPHKGAESQVRAFLVSGIQPSIPWLSHIKTAQDEINKIVKTVVID
jgi:hypothetical protein